jgi:hypothetical protein
LVKILFREYSLLHEQPGEGLLMDHLGYREFLKRNDLFEVKGGYHENTF